MNTPRVNLFIAGAAKSGTTQLHGWLANHPLICMSTPKEPFYFEWESHENSHDWYFKKYFAHYRNEPILGEARHRNMFYRFIAHDIYQYNPDARIIFLLRNPVERAFSHWLMWYRKGELRQNFLFTCIKQWIHQTKTKQQSIKSQQYHRQLSTYGPHRIATYDKHSIVASGFYSESINYFVKLFGQDQVLILPFTLLKSHPQLLLNEVTQFLGIPGMQLPNQDKNRNANPKTYTPAIYQHNWLKRLVPKAIRNQLRKALKRKGQPDMLSKLFLTCLYAYDWRQTQKWFSSYEIKS